MVEATDLPQHLVPVLEALEGDEDRPGAADLWAGVDSARLHDGHLPLDAHVGLDQRRYLVGKPGGEVSVKSPTYQW